MYTIPNVSRGKLYIGDDVLCTVMYAVDAAAGDTKDLAVDAKNTRGGYREIDEDDVLRGLNP